MPIESQLRNLIFAFEWAKKMLEKTMIYHRPKSFMRATILALLLITLPLPVLASETWPSAHPYDGNIASMPGMKSEWLACTTSDDCGLTAVTCGWPLSANKKFLTEAHDVYCSNANGCISTVCPKSGKVIPLCQSNQCTTENST